MTPTSELDFNHTITLSAPVMLGNTIEGEDPCGCRFTARVTFATPQDAIGLVERVDAVPGAFKLGQNLRFVW